MVGAGDGAGVGGLDGCGEGPGDPDMLEVSCTSRDQYPSSSWKV